MLARTASATEERTAIETTRATTIKNVKTMVLRHRCHHVFLPVSSSPLMESPVLLRLADPDVFLRAPRWTPEPDGEGERTSSSAASR